MWNQLDGLTGLLNQNSFLNRSEEMNYTNGMLIVFDVDDFKHVNDVYGHVKGDLCLSIIANCIKKAYAKYGYCYRIGGDEFAAILPQIENESDISKVAKLIIENEGTEHKFVKKVEKENRAFQTGKKALQYS